MGRLANMGTPDLPSHWFQILLTLADQDRHGLAITKDVFDRTEGRMHLWPGKLYGALKQMCDRGLIDEIDAPRGFASGGGRPRFYRITALGRRACAAEAAASGTLRRRRAIEAADQTPRDDLTCARSTASCSISRPHRSGGDTPPTCRRSSWNASPGNGIGAAARDTSSPARTRSPMARSSSSAVTGNSSDRVRSNHAIANRGERPWWHTTSGARCV